MYGRVIGTGTKKQNERRKIFLNLAFREYSGNVENKIEILFHKIRSKNCDPEALLSSTKQQDVDVLLASWLS